VEYENEELARQVKLEPLEYDLEELAQQLQMNKVELLEQVQPDKEENARQSIRADILGLQNPMGELGKHIVSGRVR
jgi:hypothetical protein